MNDYWAKYANVLDSSARECYSKKLEHGDGFNTQIVGDIEEISSTNGIEEEIVEIVLDGRDVTEAATDVQKDREEEGRVLRDVREKHSDRIGKGSDAREAMGDVKEDSKDVEDVTEMTKNEGKIKGMEEGRGKEKETGDTPDGTKEHTIEDDNISQALNLFNIDTTEPGGDVTCLRVDVDGMGCRTPTFSDVIIDGRSTQDFELMSAAHASHNMSQYMWVPFNQTVAPAPARRITCVPRNTTQQRVKIVTSTELIQMLGPKNESRGYCAVVMFYAPWCVFCARVAPHYNALARAFPQLDVLAIDAMHFSNLNSRFGTVAVPSILLFHNSKAVSRFNGTLRILDNLVSFISNVTGLEANMSVGVLPGDYSGPLPSVPSAGPDYLLWLAWSFTIIFFAVILARSTVVAQLVNSVLSFGQEHQAMH